MCLIVRLCASFLIALTLCSCAAPDKQKRFSASISEDEQDACLQRAATQALGNREGTVIVIDPQNGRLRAVVNSRLAFEQAFPPGSAIKPFTALAALEAGLIDNERRVLCPERYRQGSFEILCSHPKVATPLDLTQALAYSCNNFLPRLASG